MTGLDYEDADDNYLRANQAKQRLTLETFQKHDVNNDGCLSRMELMLAIREITGGDEVDITHIETLLDTFDKDGNGEIDFSEFQTLQRYLRVDTKKGRKSRELSVALAELAHILDEDNGKLSISEQQSFGGQNSSNIANLVKKACDKFKKDDKKLLQEISMKIFPYKDMLCIQNASIDERISKRESREVDLTEFLSEDSFEDTTHNPMDPDFKSAFSPSAMRCLALVSHNGMKSTMREFVMTNKNLLKKFRLTGTNSTMTMLKEVFKDEDPGTVMFGPSCASGPLGGDAELVAHMVSGKIGGVIFFQDPMDAHPHRADIDCLVRQALVHNTMMAETPTSAIMLLQCLRTALMENRAELIPSFFFSLQSPTVEAYKAQQSAVVNMQKQNVHNMMK